MQIFRNKTNFEFMDKSRFFGMLSMSAVVVSLLLIVFVQPRFGIDFVGGTEIQVKFDSTDASASRIRGVLSKLKFEGYDVVAFGSGATEYLVRLKEVSAVGDEEIKKYRGEVEKQLGKGLVSRFEFSPGGDKLTVHLKQNLEIAKVEEAAKGAGLDLGVMVDEAEVESEAKDGESARKCESATCTWSFKTDQVYEVSLSGVSEQVIEALRAEPWGKGAQKMRSEWVGAKVGKQLRNAGIYSIVYALIFIMVYIAFRFDLRFAPGAVIALIHDIIITLGICTIARVEVTLATVAALLTIVGYSLNDTIVVFDRIRENMQITREIKLRTVINSSINETLSRTLLTSLTTLLAVTVLLVFGWKTSLRDFSFTLLLGILVGTYSSIYVASPFVAWLDRFFAEKKA